MSCQAVQLVHVNVELDPVCHPVHGGDVAGELDPDCVNGKLNAAAVSLLLTNPDPDHTADLHHPKVSAARYH